MKRRLRLEKEKGVDSIVNHDYSCSLLHLRQGKCLPLCVSQFIFLSLSLSRVLFADQFYLRVLQINPNRLFFRLTLFVFAVRWLETNGTLTLTFFKQITAKGTPFCFLYLIFNSFSNSNSLMYGSIWFSFWDDNYCLFEGVLWFLSWILIFSSTVCSVVLICFDNWALWVQIRLPSVMLPISFLVAPWLTSLNRILWKVVAMALSRWN